LIYLPTTLVCEEGRQVPVLQGFL